MKTIKINPATRTAEYAEMSNQEMIQYLDGYILELTDMNNGLGIHSNMMAEEKPGNVFFIDGKRFAGNCVMTGISKCGMAMDMPDDVFPVIEWR